MNKPYGVYASIFKSTGIYAAGILLHRAVSILLLPLYTRYLTPAEYGVLELVDVTMSVFALVVGARVATAVAYSCGQVSTAEEKSLIYTTNMVGSAMAAALAIAAGWLAAPSIGKLVLGTPDATAVFRIAVLGLALSFPAESLLGRLRVEDRPVAFGILNLVRLVLNVGLNVVLLVFLGFGFKAILWSNVACNLAVSAFGAVSTCRSHGARFSLALLLSMLRFAIPVGVVGLSLMVFHVADRFFLQHYTTLAEIGLYSLGYKLGMMISYVQMAFNQHWSAKSYDLLKGEGASTVFARIFTYFLAVMMSAAVATWVFAGPALHLLATPQFFGCLIFVPWIVSAYVVRSAADYMRIAIYVSRRPDLDAWANSCTALFCLAAYALLIPRFGALGAAWATGLTSAVMVAFSFFMGRRVFPMRFESRRIAIILAGGLAVLALHSRLAPSTLPSQFAAGLLACAVFGGGVLWLGVLSSEEKRSIGLTLRGFVPARLGGLSA